jgi:site-specific recombinase XerD
LKKRRSTFAKDRGHSIWKGKTKVDKPEDWVFARLVSHGRRFFWGQAIMRNVIQTRAREIGITRAFGWHTIRHTYSTLLRSKRADVKVMQELPRYASSRVTLETCTQAITGQKREAQSSVVNLICMCGPLHMYVRSIAVMVR